MAAGLGFKTFATGDVLSAGDVNGYLMQGVLVFASAAARDAAITSPQEGQFAYLKDTNVTTYYTGSAWANIDTTGMTNPMTTTGDTIYSSSGSTPARLGIGTTGQVLTVAGGIPSWASASSGGMTLLSTTTLSGASVTISSIPQTYIDLVMYLVNYKPSADTDYPVVQFNSDDGANRYANRISNYSANQSFNATYFPLMQEFGNDNSVATGLNWTRIPYYANTTTWKMANTMDLAVNGTTTTNYNHSFAYSYYNQTTAISSLKILANIGTMTSGTIYLYGVK